MSTALAVCHGAFGRVNVYQLDRPMRTHAHREGHLIFHLGGPAAIVTICDIRYPVEPGAGVAINPWQPHSFQPGTGDEPGVFLVAYISDRWLDRDQEGRGRLRFGANRVDVEKMIRTAAFGLADALVTGANYQIIDRGLNKLFDACLDESWSKRGPLALHAGPSDCVDFRVRRSLRLLHDGLGRGVELDAVARDAGLSRPHFFKLFRENTGMTPALYANTMRIERALDRLVGSRDSVTDIGYELGFSSQSHFTHFFAAHVGFAPTLYRTLARVVSE